MVNIAKDDLDALEVALSNSKPKLKVTSSLDKVAKDLNFGSPKIDNEEIKINLSSPQINNKPEFDNTKEKIVTNLEVDKLVKKDEFSADSISFIPYGASYITAKEALEKVSSKESDFLIIQKYYISKNGINLILDKIKKIYDLSSFQKQNLINFYSKILQLKTQEEEQINKAKLILSKIKTKSFREKISVEIQRMLPNQGDLHRYYQQFDLVSPEAKKVFLNSIANIDQYILKKAKELIAFRELDINYRYQEVLKFEKIVGERNILIKNFHLEIEKLANQRRMIQEYAYDVQDKINKLTQITREYGRNGKYGKTINTSSSILIKEKDNYFNTIAKLIEPTIIKLNQFLFDLDSGAYASLTVIKQSLEKINIEQVLNQCRQLYEKTYK